MNDYISRDDVLKAIDYQHEVNNVFKSEAAYVQMWETINDDMGIKAAAVQPVNQWISVKDRLPENHKLVLCYAQSTTGESCCYILGTLSNDKFWFLQAHDGHHLSFPNLHLVVTHWQPLPDPPVNP